MSHPAYQRTTTWSSQTCISTFSLKKKDNQVNVENIGFIMKLGAFSRQPFYICTVPFLSDLVACNHKKREAVYGAVYLPEVFLIQNWNIFSNMQHLRCSSCAAVAEEESFLFAPDLERDWYSRSYLKGLIQTVACDRICSRKGRTKNCIQS